MAIKLEIGDSNSRTAILIRQTDPGSDDWDDDLWLTVREAKSLLAKLPAIIEKAKTHKPMKWNGTAWVK
jgi:hypothetical protein